MRAENLIMLCALVTSVFSLTASAQVDNLRTNDRTMQNDASVKFSRNTFNYYNQNGQYCTAREVLNVNKSWRYSGSANHYPDGAVAHILLLPTPEGHSGLFVGLAEFPKEGPNNTETAGKDNGRDNRTFWTFPEPARVLPNTTLSILDWCSFFIERTAFLFCHYSLPS